MLSMRAIEQFSWAFYPSIFFKGVAILPLPLPTHTLQSEDDLDPTPERVKGGPTT